MKRSEAEISLYEGLKRLDQQMKGDARYEFAWSNYPEKPEKSPGEFVRELIAKHTPPDE